MWNASFFTRLSWTQHRSWRAFFTWFEYVPDFDSNGSGITDFGVCPSLIVRRSEKKDREERSFNELQKDRSTIIKKDRSTIVKKDRSTIGNKGSFNKHKKNDR